MEPFALSTNDMNAQPSVPYNLAAVSITAAEPDNQLPSVADIVNHVSQLAPVFLAMHTLSKAAPGLQEQILIMFDEQESARMAVACFDGFCWNDGTVLKVKLSEKQPLQTLAQVLVKSSATVSARTIGALDVLRSRKEGKRPVSLQTVKTTPVSCNRAVANACTQFFF